MNLGMDLLVEATRKKIVQTCFYLFNRGFAHGSSGNISIKTEKGYATTPTGSSFKDLTETDVSFLDEVGNLISGKKPTKEVPLHLAWYKANPDHNAVIHLHSAFATAVSCLEDLDSHNVLPALTPYQIMKIGKVPLIPYEKPGDIKLAESIEKMGKGSRAVLMSNHGLVCGEENIDAAVEIVEELEATCRLFFILDGKKIHYLSKEDVFNLKEGVK